MSADTDSDAGTGVAENTCANSTNTASDCAEKIGACGAERDGHDSHSIDVKQTAGGGRQLLDTHWDIIIGSDLVYNEQGVRMLPQVSALAWGSCIHAYIHAAWGSCIHAYIHAY